MQKIRKNTIIQHVDKESENMFKDLNNVREKKLIIRGTVRLRFRKIFLDIIFKILKDLIIMIFNTIEMLFIV